MDWQGAEGLGKRSALVHRAAPTLRDALPRRRVSRAAATRATEAIREWDARFKDDEIWLAASHGDIIKAIVSEATGAPLDLFQRIAIDPASITVIRFGSERPTILRLNESAAGIESLFAPKEKRRSLFGRLRGDN